MSIAVPNQKGGVKKTTTITHTAYVYATYLNKKVLLIDLDPQKNAHSIFIDDNVNIPKENSIYASFYDRPLQIRETRIPNLHIVPSHIKMANIDGELKGSIGAERILADAIKQIEGDYDEIFIDCPPTLGFILINALTASQNIVIPFSHAGFEVEGLTDLMETIRKVKVAYNPKLNIIGLLQTVTDSTNLCTEFRTRFIEKYGNLVFDSKIPRSIAIQEAINEHTTIFEFKTSKQKKENIVNAYIQFAKELYKKTHSTLSIKSI